MSLGRKLICICIACSCILALVAFACGNACVNNEQAMYLREQVIKLNESRTLLAESAETPANTENAEAPTTPEIPASESQNTPSSNIASQADAALASAQDSLRSAASTQELTPLISLAILCVAAIACICIVSAYAYVSIARPFIKLEQFADEVASGNLDIPLTYERNNPFGRFAWAFDHMRTELKRARALEQAAIEGNKTALAALSHDLRTPIASLRTYAEALQMGLDRTPKERAEYTEVIMNKCDEMSQLIDDLLTHSLSDLDRISVETQPTPAAPLIRRAAEEFGATQVSITHLDNATILADELRLTQAIENLLVNAHKYAPASQVIVEGHAENDTYVITVRDFGQGIAPQDIPFVFNRFFRGSNSEGISGAGLGLFIVQYVIKKMDGKIAIENAHPGLRIIIELQIAPVSSPAS